MHIDVVLPRKEEHPPLCPAALLVASHLRGVARIPPLTAAFPAGAPALLLHDNQTGRWLSTLHGVWNPREPHAFLVGSMQQPRCMEVYSASGVVSRQVPLPSSKAPLLF